MHTCCLHRAYIYFLCNLHATGMCALCLRYVMLANKWWSINFPVWPRHQRTVRSHKIRDQVSTLLIFDTTRLHLGVYPKMGVASPQRHGEATLIAYPATVRTQLLHSDLHALFGGYGKRAVHAGYMHPTSASHTIRMRLICTPYVRRMTFGLPLCESGNPDLASLPPYGEATLGDGGLWPDCLESICKLRRMLSASVRHS